MARLLNGMTEEEIIESGKTFSVNPLEAQACHADVKKALDAISYGMWKSP